MKFKVQSSRPRTITLIISDGDIIDVSHSNTIALLKRLSITVPVEDEVDPMSLLTMEPVEIVEVAAKTKKGKK